MKVPAEEEVGGPEGRQVHGGELRVPAAVGGQVDVVFTRTGQRREPLLTVN